MVAFWTLHLACRCSYFFQLTIQFWLFSHIYVCMYVCRYVLVKFYIYVFSSSSWASHTLITCFTFSCFFFIGRHLFCVCVCVFQGFCQSPLSSGFSWCTCYELQWSEISFFRSWCFFNSTFFRLPFLFRFLLSLMCFCTSLSIILYHFKCLAALFRTYLIILSSHCSMYLSTETKTFDGDDSPSVFFIFHV